MFRASGESGWVTTPPLGSHLHWSPPLPLPSPTVEAPLIVVRVIRSSAGHAGRVPVARPAVRAGVKQPIKFVGCDRLTRVRAVSVCHAHDTFLSRGVFTSASSGTAYHALPWSMFWMNFLL